MLRTAVGTKSKAYKGLQNKTVIKTLFFIALSLEFNFCSLAGVYFNRHVSPPSRCNFRYVSVKIKKNRRFWQKNPNDFLALWNVDYEINLMINWFICIYFA